MTEDQFEQLLQDSTQQLRDKQARLERDCHLQAMARWQLNEADAELTFFDASGVAQLVFSVTPLGSFAAAQAAARAHRQAQGRHMALTATIFKVDNPLKDIPNVPQPKGGYGFYNQGIAWGAWCLGAVRE